MWFGVFFDFDFTSSVYSSISTPTTSAASTHARSVNLTHGLKAGWNSSRHRPSASHTVMAKTTQINFLAINRPPRPSTKGNVNNILVNIDLNDLGVYLIRSGSITPSCQILGVGLGGLDPKPDTTFLGGLHRTETYFRDSHTPSTAPSTQGTTAIVLSPPPVLQPLSLLFSMSITIAHTPNGARAAKPH